MEWAPVHTLMSKAFLSLITPIVIIEYFQIRSQDNYVILQLPWLVTTSVMGIMLVLSIIALQSVQRNFIYFQF
jgi:hypothetical protein